jgi:hypothetical protein
MMDSIPSEPPPSYDQAAASSSSAPPPRTHLDVPHKSGIPPAARRSMEDESRPLPSGWIRQFDAQSGHQFFVDTTAKPPRSIWSHPYDDSTYMNSLSDAERQKILGMHRTPSKADIEAMSSDDDAEDGHHHAQHSDRFSGNSTAGASAGAGASSQSSTYETNPSGLHKFGRKMKDKVTGSTHAERVAQRKHREEEEQRTYERHRMLRQAMQRAVETGQPQHVGKDKNGKDIYIEPPEGAQGLPQGAYGYNPYTQGPYANPNATFIRPQYQYSRPYGGGYGGGYGLPLAGGLMGGLLLGDMMGMGMGGMGMGGMGMGMGGMGGGMMF